MSAEHSTPSAASGKPAKPYPNFPLFPTLQNAGQKIRGKLHYSGSWAGRWKAALVERVATAFLNQKKALVKSGELSPRTVPDYKESLRGACICVRQGPACGRPGRRSLQFSEKSRPVAGYKLVSKIYADDLTDDLPDFKVFGFIAQSGSDVVVAIRGTEGVFEWIMDEFFCSGPVSFRRCGPSRTRLH